MKNQKLIKLSTGGWLGCLILLSGVVAMITLAGMKEEPMQKLTPEKPLAIEVTEIQFGDYPTGVTCFGSMVCRDTVDLSPEISGRVIWVNPNLEDGLRVKKGDLLFRLDSADYENRRRQVEAQEKEIRQRIENLDFQFGMDKEQKEMLERNRALSFSQFERLEKLYASDEVVSRQAVEKIEMDLNATRLSIIQMEKQIMLYSGEVQIEKFKLESCRATLEEIDMNIQRCYVQAPFSGRVKKHTVESGMFVKKAEPAVTLCDEASLEVHITLSPKDLTMLTGASDINAVLSLPSTIQWTGSVRPMLLKGQVNRIIKYSGTTQTLVAAVALDRTNSQGTDVTPGILEGMFCEVTVKGRPLTGVAMLPHKAVMDNNFVYRVIDERLEKTRVRVVRRGSNAVFIESGLSLGDRVAVSLVSEADASRKVNIVTSESNHE